MGAIFDYTFAHKNRTREVMTGAGGQCSMARGEAGILCVNRDGLPRYAGCSQQLPASAPTGRMAEGVGIEPTTDSAICPPLVLKTSRDTSPVPFHK